MLKDVIANDIMLARKAREAEKMSILVVLKGEIERLDDKSDASVVGTIKKMVSNITASTNNQYEIDVISTYLPSQLTEENLKEIVNDLKEAGVYTDMKGFMGHFKNNYPGLYDGKVLSVLVKTTLSTI